MKTYVVYNPTTGEIVCFEAQNYRLAKRKFAKIKNWSSTEGWRWMEEERRRYFLGDIEQHENQVE